MNVFLLFFSLPLFAQSTPPNEPQKIANPTPPYANESQASVVQTSGNSETESFSFKQVSVFTRRKNTGKAFGSYLNTSTDDAETARRWDLGVRYERALSEKWSGFVGVMVESDRFAGYVHRYNSDVGAKYALQKSEKFDSSVELGYRYVHQNNIGSDAHTHYSSLRAYIDGIYRINETNSAKLWLEYLPNLDESEDYQANGEASLSSAISTHFSLKVAYLVRTDNLPNKNKDGTEKEKTDTTFTTALVAKF